MKLRIALLIASLLFIANVNLSGRSQSIYVHASSPLMLRALQVSSSGPDPARPGWQVVSIDLAIVNDNSGAVAPPPLVAPFHGKLSITEGHSYNMALQNWPFVYQQDPFYGFQLPSHTAICGLNPDDEPDLLSAQSVNAHGDIPQGTHPLVLSVAGFPPIDLKHLMPQKACVPTALKGSVFAPAHLGRTGGPIDAVVQFHPKGTLKTMPDSKDKDYPVFGLRVTVQNKNRFEDLNLRDLRIWAVYDNGVWADPVSNAASYGYPSGSTPPIMDCPTASPIGDRRGMEQSTSYTVGPGQSSSFTLCLPASSYKVVGLAISSAPSHAFAFTRAS